MTKEHVEILHKEYLGELADAFISPGTERDDPRVSPLYASLGELPPMLVQVGSAEVDRALVQYRAAIGYEEQCGNLYGAGGARPTSPGHWRASAASRRRWPAEVALANFQTYGDGAAADIEQTQQLVEAIQHDQQQPLGGTS